MSPVGHMATSNNSLVPNPIKSNVIEEASRQWGSNPGTLSSLDLNLYLTFWALSICESEVARFKVSFSHPHIFQSDCVVAGAAG